MNEDIVELILKGETILIAKEYSVTIGFMQVPSQFSIVIGSGVTAIDLMRRYPAGTPFALRVNGVVQFMGRTDGFERPAGEATELHITGRDRMAQLLDDDIDKDRSFTNATFKDLADAAIKGARIEGYSLVFDASAHRRAITGTPIVETTKVKQKVLIDINQLRGVATSGFPPGVDLNFVPLNIDPTIEIEKTVTRIKGYKVEKPIEWKAGQSHYAAANKEFARGGLFLRAGVDPDGEDENIFLLSEPNGAQDPLFALVNTRESNPAANVVSVLPPKITDITTNRHTRYIVRARTGGGKDGRKQIEGSFTDKDMVALGIDKQKVVIDEHCKSTEQANYLARKLCAEACRQNRVFTYTMPRRHTAPLLRDPSRRAILAPDICVSLKDDEHGMEGVFWVERVCHRQTANGGTFTDITLMLPDDLVFGEGEFLANATRKVSGRRHHKKI